MLKINFMDKSILFFSIFYLHAWGKYFDRSSKHNKNHIFSENFMLLSYLELKILGVIRMKYLKIAITSLFEEIER